MLKIFILQMQRAEMEELRQREANITALQAIGPRKKPKLEAGGIAGSSGQVCYIIQLHVVLNSFQSSLEILAPLCQNLHSRVITVANKIRRHISRPEVAQAPSKLGIRSRNLLINIMGFCGDLRSPSL
jgi:hypothetical protein